MSSTSFRTFDLEGRPFKDSMRLANVVEVQFRTNFLKHECDAQQLQLVPGDHVICKTDKGPVIARVTGHVRRQVIDPSNAPRILRKANDHDIIQADRNEELERSAYRFALKRISARGLPMKLVRAQYMQDGSRVVFYFSAEGRIDFRDLVKDLAHQFRTRIEMYQIGVRDGARMIGGIGSCGRELCCSTFLENFAPVSIRMAKQQGLTLNPAKVSGMCGRLMCCLVYEQQLYRRMRKRLPKAKTRVDTPDGVGTVKSVDPINQRVTVVFDDSNRKTFANDQILLHDPNRPKTGGTPGADYDWEALDAESDSTSNGQNDGKPKRSRSRRRRRKPKNKD